MMNPLRMILSATALASCAALLEGGAATARAQTVTGTVRSAGVPIVGATVRLLELDRAVRTGARGQFRFSNVPNGTYTLFVGVLGYAAAADTVRITGGSATTAFDLTPSAIPLEAVVVSASPLPRTPSHQYQSTASKSQGEVLSGAGSSFAEKISDLPGVTARLNGSAPARPVLRGLGNNEVLVLENGLRTGDIATFDPAHATPIAAIAVSQIDVVRGPATILYGPNTIGGLVNVITNAVPAVAGHAVSGTVALEANSVSDQVAGYVNNVFSGDKHAFRLSAGGVHTQDTRIPSGIYVDPGSGMAFSLARMPQTFDHSGEVGLGYSYQDGVATMGVAARHYTMNYGIPGVPPNPNWMTVPPTTSRIAQTRNTVELRGLWNAGGSAVRQWKLDASYNDYEHSEFPTQQDSTGVSAPQANHFHKREFNGVLQLRQAPLGKERGRL